MLGFTGTYKGKRISIQGTGMGIPSMSIYITELMKDYGVKTLIRVGSAGSYQEDVKIRDIVVALSTSTDSNINNRRFKGASFAPTVNFDLLSKVLKTAEEKNIKIKAGKHLILYITMCDESFTINATADISENIDLVQIYFWVTLLN